MAFDPTLVSPNPIIWFDSGSEIAMWEMPTSLWVTSNRYLPVSGDFQRYQTEFGYSCAKTSGGDFSEVAPAVFAKSQPCLPWIASAFARLSFEGGGTTRYVARLST